MEEQALTWNKIFFIHINKKALELQIKIFGKKKVEKNYAQTTWLILSRKR